LDRIQEPEGEKMKFWALQRVSKTTVNLYIATLRKSLRYACNTLLFSAKTSHAQATRCSGQYS
jgi:hypothetical protein